MANQKYSKYFNMLCLFMNFNVMKAAIYSRSEQDDNKNGIHSSEQLDNPFYEICKTECQNSTFNQTTASDKPYIEERCSSSNPLKTKQKGNDVSEHTEDVESVQKYQKNNIDECSEIALAAFDQIIQKCNEMPEETFNELDSVQDLLDVCIDTYAKLHGLSSIITLLMTEEEELALTVEEVKELAKKYIKNSKKRNS